MDIHVALQIILAAEAPGALIARVGFLVGFGRHGCYDEDIGIPSRSGKKEDCSCSRVVRRLVGVS